jgi:uncharacterized protein (DUF885 family)
MHAPLSRAISVASLLLVLNACTLTNGTTLPADSNVTSDIPAETQEQAEQTLQTLLDEYETYTLESSPMLQSYRGLKTHYGEWDDISETSSDQYHRQMMVFLDRLHLIPLNALSHDSSLNARLLTYELEQSAKLYPYRHYNFPVNPMFGLHTQIPNFMINVHSIDNIDDAKAYIERIENSKILLRQLIEQLKIRAQKGILPPAFVFEKVIASSQNVIRGYPLDDNKADTPNILWRDFNQKLDKIAPYPSSREYLEKNLTQALQKSYAPAYRELISYLQNLASHPGKNTGFSQYEHGQNFYALALKEAATTDVTPEYVHALGLKRVAEIQAQITALLPALGVESLPALFEKTRHDPSLYYQGDAGKQQALEDTKTYIRNMNQKLGQAFLNVPDIKLMVKTVESYREISSPVAFYESPSDDGTRPGIYYMNMAKLSEMPKFQFAALTYHETLPGHHLQIINALQASELPDFRRHGNYTAYTEGWALYAESLAGELGAYQDPWQEYGALLMSLWRATRLVLDTGLHYYGWSKEQAIKYRMDNTPFSLSDSEQSVERYIVMPGQATTYMLGAMAISAERDKAKKALGKRFDIKEFHDFILSMGPVPLNLLSEEVDRWITDY